MGCLLFTVFQSVFSQSHSSKNNYTGSWETPTSWSPTWTVPQTNISGYNITINGYITLNSSLSFSGGFGNLIVNDTLVIKGDLSLGDFNNLTIMNNGILIVRGDLTIDKHADIIANGYIIITGNIYKGGPKGEGSFTSNDNPVKVFVGGTIPSGLIDDNHKFPALNCTAHPTIPYPNSTCSYGNMTDLTNDPIYPFFQSTCTTATPIITAGGPTTFCAGGSVTLTSSTGSTYLWSTGATSPSINVTTTGSYTVRVTNASGCQSAVSAATIVTVNALPVTPTITAGGPTTFCADGSVTLTSSAGSTYLWSTGATTPSINVTTAGSYIVRITNANGCQSAASVATIVTVNALPVAPTIIAGSPTTFCDGGNVTLTTDLATSYLWSNAATTPSINITTAGSYTVQVKDANGCQSAASAATVVNVNELPVVNAGKDTTIPYGTSVSINATVTGNGPFTFSWTPSAQLVNALIEDPTTVNLATTTVYTLTATSTITSCSNSDAVKITISGGALSSIPTATPGIICAGADIQLDALASGGSGSYTYTWTSIPAGFTSAIASPIVNPTVNTTYNVTVFDGFTTVNPQVAVMVNALPITPIITASGPTTFCAGDSVTLNSSAGSTYLWSTGETTASINIITSGNYTVRVTNANGCQSIASTATIVIVNALPIIPTITTDGPTTFCNGDSVTLTSGAGTSYLWSNAATTPNINVTTAGSYTVQITNESGCQSAASVAIIITVNTLPIPPTITAEGPTTFCDGDSVTLTSGAGTSYLWSNAATTPNISITTAGSYTVQVTDANGCQSASSTVTEVVVNVLPTVSISITDNSGIANNDGIICEGDTATLTASGGASYNWSSGETAPEITKFFSGNYTVTVTDTNGCGNTTGITLTVNDLPTPIITVTDNSGIANNDGIICDGETATLTASGGIGYSWSSGEATPEITKNIEGTYFVTVTDANGCRNTANKTIKITMKPLSNAGNAADVCGKEYTLNAKTNTGTGEWSVALGTGNVTFSPDQNDPSATIKVSEFGSYQLTWTVINENCLASSEVSITFHEIPVAKAGKDQELNNVFSTKMEAELSSSQTGEWSIISGSGLFNDINSPISGVSDLSSGENILLWTIKSEGCEASDSVIIEVNDLFVPQVITPNGDLKNDFFIIKDIENNGPAELIIFNRWGNEVYDNSSYMNNWDGRSNNGKELSNDTYFYVLKLGDGKITKGFVVIKR